MGLKQWFERLMMRGARPTAPTRSVIDPVAEKARRDKAAADEFDKQLAIEKGRRSGW